jgi:hypothetical protein
MVGILNPATPVTIPAPASIVALLVLLLFQTPPISGLERYVVAFAHTTLVPPIGEGNGLMVIGVVAIQLVGNVYVIIVVPGTRPVSSPEKEIIDATEVLEELHTPNGVPSTNVIVGLMTSVTHAPRGAVIGTGNGLTSTDVVMIQLVGNV